MGYKYIKANDRSYGGKRLLEDVKYIVIHYTGNDGDTAKNNCDYFKRERNRPAAGAHFFVDQKGTVIKSVAMSLIAWSVGGYFTKSNGAGKYYKICENHNSVSIELCDCAHKDPSKAMTESTRKLVAYIQKECPNAKTIIRHWDVNGKSCPARMTGTNNKKWISFKKAITSSKPENTKSSTDKSSTTKKKSNETIAKEVIAGKWGNGETRKKKLKAAGYDYNAVQKIVNRLLK